MGMIKKAEFFDSYYDSNKIPNDRRSQIAFGGRSNVGKSSLLNSLVGQKKLARISRTPGRTQAINFFLIDDRYFFVDLPGYGYAKAPDKVRDKWGELVDQYLNRTEMLKAMVFLIDCRRDMNELDLMMLEWMDKKNVNYIPVLTKADKLGKSNLMAKVRETEKILKVVPIPFSIITGIGIRELHRWIESKLDS
jgi:GTP-binding protein